MPEPFIEERLTLDVRMGASYGDNYAVEVVTTSNGKEYRKLVHQFPVRKFNIAFVMDTDDIGTKVLDLYHRVFGQYAGFRVRIGDDYSTNGASGSPTPVDQTLALVSSGVYQLQKYYGAASPVISVGRPARSLFKPVTSTTRIAIAAQEILHVNRTRWTVDTTTGLVTFAANISKAITAISKAASASITVGSSHGYLVNDSVHISGVVGMTEINGMRATVTAVFSSTITVNIDSTLFTAYTSGGTVNTAPQSGEAVTGGCLFDIPMRFNTSVHIEMTDRGIRSAQGIELIELIAL